VHKHKHLQRQFLRRAANRTNSQVIWPMIWSLYLLS